MRKFLLGFVAGAATYHVVLGPPNEELISELRTAIQKLDERLAAEQSAEKASEEPVTDFEPPNAA